MESTRQNKIARLIQKELGIIFQEESRNLFSGAMITVTKTNITRDLSISKIYLSLFAVKDKEALLEKIQNNSGKLRHILASRVKNQLRSVPQLNFYLDDSLDYIDRINELL